MTREGGTRGAKGRRGHRKICGGVKEESVKTVVNADYRRGNGGKKSTLGPRLSGG